MPRWRAHNPGGACDALETLNSTNKRLVLYLRIILGHRSCNPVRKAMHNNRQFSWFKQYQRYHSVGDLTIILIYPTRLWMSMTGGRLCQAPRAVTPGTEQGTRCSIPSSFTYARGPTQRKAVVRRTQIFFLTITRNILKNTLLITHLAQHVSTFKKS